MSNTSITGFISTHPKITDTFWYELKNTASKSLNKFACLCLNLYLEDAWSLGMGNPGIPWRMCGLEIFRSAECTCKTNLV